MIAEKPLNKRKRAESKREETEKRKPESWNRA